MKLFAIWMILISLLTGCSGTDDRLEQAISFRKQILESQGCTFRTVITADYGDALYTFHMDCTTDSEGNLQFTVTQPETIAGITGSISEDMAALTFDDKVLAFPMLAEGDLTPVSAPWILIDSLRSGYLTACSIQNNDLYLYIDDSFEEDALHLQILMDADMQPQYAEILWKDRRILTLEIRDFTIL